MTNIDPKDKEKRSEEYRYQKLPKDAYDDIGFLKKVRKLSSTSDGFDSDQDPAYFEELLERDQLQRDLENPTRGNKPKFTISDQVGIYTSWLSASLEGMTQAEFCKNNLGERIKPRTLQRYGKKAREKGMPRDVLVELAETDSYQEWLNDAKLRGIMS